MTTRGEGERYAEYARRALESLQAEHDPDPYAEHRRRAFEAIQEGQATGELRDRS